MWQGAKPRQFVSCVEILRHIGPYAEVSYKKQKRFADAEPLLRRALTIKEKTFDPGHPSLVTGLKNFASLLRALGRDEEAVVFEQRAGALPPKRRSDGQAA